MAKFLGSLDTNVLLRLLINDIPEQHMAAKNLLVTADAQVAVADTVIIELVFVLDRYYGFSRLQIAETIDGLSKLKELNFNRILFELATSVFVGHPALSFEDCCLSVYAKLNDAEPLWTFDQKLSKQVPNTK